MPPKIESFTTTQVVDLMKKNEEMLRNFFNDQMKRVEDKVDTLIGENAILKKEIEDLKTSLNFQEEITTNKEKEFKEKIKGLGDQEIRFHEKISELEDRNRRNNLRFEGIVEETDESWERSEELVKTMISKTLGVEDEVIIERAHRSGQRKAGWNRTIVAKMLNYKDKEKVLSAYRGQKLWLKQIYVNEDFSRETMLKRKELFLQVKELKKRGITSKVVYNRIIIEKPDFNVNVDNDQIDSQ